MKVTLIALYSGRRLHIAGRGRFTLCGGFPAKVVRQDYELTDAEPTIAGRTGICKTCRRKAEGDA